MHGYCPIRIARPRYPSRELDQDQISTCLHDLRDNIHAKQVVLDSIRNVTRYSQGDAQKLAAFITQLKNSSVDEATVRRFELELEKMETFVYQLFFEGTTALVHQNSLTEGQACECARKVVRLQSHNVQPLDDSESGQTSAPNPDDD
ncbi:hypothetical protein CGCA056_v003258 [Colletotrichum aenigma]|uniref:uncharacterized protein n=1 Tax=Colletotrichum aenigma TaxID=1215731 RepID=UPI00187279D8|nr:uncharacterized protein CGCA056_v003258 [Colletotrichum aenigma]KAF5525813.1 hypothetical protein CGCA056_v003258 [Colletotrichum aenigma]